MVYIMHGLIADGGLLIVTLRDDVSANEKRMKAYVEAQGLAVLHCDKNCAWLRLL
jgi:hypothetical protein